MHFSASQVGGLLCVVVVEELLCKASTRYQSSSILRNLRQQQRGLLLQQVQQRLNFFVCVCFGSIYLELIFSSKIFNYCFNECSAALFCSARRFHFVLLPILESSSPRKEELTLGPSTSSCGCACSRAGSQWGRRRRWPGSGRRCTSSRRRARSGR